MTRTHPPESAAEHAVRNVVTADEDERVSSILERLTAASPDAIEAVYVVDAEGRLSGAVTLVDLLRAPRDAAAGSLMDRGYARVGPHDDQEHAAATALERGASSVAVVDDAERLLGVISARSLIEILRREHVEDLHRLAGIQRENARTQAAFESPPTRRARHRLPWLLVGLAGSMLAAMVVAGFEQTLQSNLSIAFFVPTIVYLADAVGTQTEAIAVRGLSLSRKPLGTLLADELRTGLLIGVTLGVLAFPVVAFAFGNVRLGFAVAIAIVVAGGAATSIGLLLPWLLERAGADPAFGSGPLATIIQDVLSLLIYFAVATLVV